MRKRDELNDPRSCLSRARADEMLFVLLERDLAAPAAIREWIEERIRLGKNQREDAQITEAEAWIKTVLWEHGKQDKPPPSHAALTARVAELMAALRDAWNALPSSSPAWARVDAALAKVEGETP
jgi:hypothetical protein